MDGYKTIQRAIVIAVVSLSVNTYANIPISEVDLIQEAMFELYSGTEQGNKRAYELAQEAYTLSESSMSAKVVGKFYYDGKGVEQDKQTALEYFLIASPENDEAKYMAGWMMVNGDGVPVDFEYGSELIREAADDGFVMAQRYITETSLEQSKREQNPQIKGLLELNAKQYGSP